MVSVSFRESSLKHRAARYACDSFDEFMIQGDPREHKFIGYYFKGDRVCGASAQGKYKEILSCFEAFN